MRGSTLRVQEQHFVCRAGDLGLCRAADLPRPISAAWQMKNERARVTVAAVKKRLHADRLDQVVAVALVVLGQVQLWAGNPTPGLPKAFAVPLTIVIPGLLAFRRRRPLEVGIAVALGTDLIFAFGARSYSVPLALAWMCALYGLSVWTSTRGFLTGVGVLVAANAATLPSPHQTFHNTVLFTGIPLVAMVIARRAVRDRQLRAEALAARAELAEIRAHEAVAEERARIARELHDLVAHNVSMMVVQAGAERHTLPEDQASTRETLSSIEQAGRQALAEARRLLGVLRPDGQPERLEPQPSIEGIASLVEQVQRAGQPVTLAIEGERVPLPAGLDLCAYRIVQEALTNALKHAGGAQAQVRVRYAPRALEVEVRDNGHGTTQTNGLGTGHGLIGMRERVALYGGQLTAGPRQGGGFEVNARLPLA
jgi:signal transduction histidine kinase